jgi:hypothetical protein
MTGLEQIPIKLTRHCERSEAIQCCGAGLDCFVAPLLAMMALIPSDRKPGCSRNVGHRAMGDSVIMERRYHV